MNDSEIYELSMNVIGAIANDLSDGIYSELEGSLSISWTDEPRVCAWAESKSAPEKPPSHRIVISYELARQFYRDAEDYHDFCEGNHLESQLELFFKDFDPKPSLPDSLVKDDSVRNMFIGALTWVFFHELGHLTQEHGFIRSKFSGAKQISLLEDCESNGYQSIDARAAIISHVTEFAADIEATQSCMGELMRHFLHQNGEWTKEHIQSFQDSLYLVVCGISCALYRFYGERRVTPEAVPSTSHPTPVRRLEVCLPNIFEKLDLGGHGEQLHGLNRKQLVHLCTGAAYNCGFFWLFLYAQENGIPDNFMPKGLIQDRHKESYWVAIVAAWDEIELEIKRVRRFGNELGLLSFTERFRSEIAGVYV